MLLSQTSDSVDTGATSPISGAIKRKFGPTVTVPLLLSSSIATNKMNFLGARITNTAWLARKPLALVWDIQQFSDRTLLPKGL